MDEPDDFGGDARVLETYISYLRKKVDRRPCPHPRVAMPAARRPAGP
jgi:DNA-binding response OmpR family regulator